MQATGQPPPGFISASRGSGRENHCHFRGMLSKMHENNGQRWLTFAKEGMGLARDCLS